MATEQYASRYTTPRPQSSGRPASIKGGVHADSPLRKEAEPVGEQQLDDNGDVIHIDPPAHRGSKIHGGGQDPPTEDLGPEGGNTAEEGGWVTERGYGIPILASDEVKKHPDSEWRQPAISPEMERRGDDYTVNEDGTPAYITKVRTHSRSSSRNNNQSQRVVPSPAQFDRGGTPLESHKEYEPLFPEDEEESSKKPKGQVEKLKRPSVARHHFPSQDVWEDTPGSLQLQTTVETPEVPDEPETPAGDVSAAKVFEKPETEEARKDNITKEDQQSFLPEHTKRFAAENKLIGKVRGEEAPLRPGMQQRFPSQDIWEDAPEHGQWETTVSTPQTEETNEYAEDSPVDGKPSIPARTQIPVRPQKREESLVDKKTPIIPDRPKPQIPVRPSKPTTNARGEEATTEPQAKATDRDAPQPKAKPPIPARPGGSKIAALQAGFLNDLNSKLGLGPQAPKVKEPEPEVEAEPAAPLQDARKSRAKGPQRRKPAASPAPAATITAEVAVPHQKLSFGPVTAIWSLGHDGVLDVPAATIAAKLQSKLQAPIIPEESESMGELAQETGLAKTTSKSSEPAELTKSTSRDSEVAEPSDLSKTISQGKEGASNTISRGTEVASNAISQGKEAASNLLGPDEPLVSKTAPGSVDAPGAFPGMDGHDEATGGVSLEQPSKAQAPVEKSGAEKPSIEHAPAEAKILGRRMEDELEKEKEDPSTAGTAPPNEGAGFTQSFAG